MRTRSLLRALVVAGVLMFGGATDLMSRTPLGWNRRSDSKACARAKQRVYSLIYRYDEARANSVAMDLLAGKAPGATTQGPASAVPVTEAFVEHLERTLEPAKGPPHPDAEVLDVHLDQLLLVRRPQGARPFEVFCLTHGGLRQGATLRERTRPRDELRKLGVNNEQLLMKAREKAPLELGPVIAQVFLVFWVLLGFDLVIYPFRTRDAAQQPGPGRRALAGLVGAMMLFIAATSALHHLTSSIVRR